jgi:hypothetical protein
MRPENTGSVSPQDQKNQLRIPRDQKLLAQYRHKTRKASSEFHETRKYRLGIPRDQKSGSVSNKTRNILAQFPMKP